VLVIRGRLKEIPEKAEVNIVKVYVRNYEVFR
jgi:hypothetical protein